MMVQWGSVAQEAKMAVEAARQYRGATSPNPPVGAVGWDYDGKLLAVAAHPRAGEGHAEVQLIRRLSELGGLDRLHTVFVTLEPCNHQGRTGPCTEALLHTPVRQVWFGTHDPNPQVQGGGASRLRAAGLQAELVPDTALQAACQDLIAPFRKWSTTRMPYVTLKTAHRREVSDLWSGMIPISGSGTFSSAESLKLAHELRRRADAILTGSGTVLADSPRFDVRHVQDHDLQRPRKLIVLDRRSRVSLEWWARARSLGFERLDAESPSEALTKLGAYGCLEVLVEAGPTLSRSLLEQGLCDEWVQIRSGGERPDQVEVVRVHGNY
jgi:diaminohydroxyphosphoribosylaminopyrimidine deaminase/5-amino-6-(5-phosphoribosylamino)uracil reductase